MKFKILIKLKGRHRETITINSFEEDVEVIYNEGYSFEDDNITQIPTFLAAIRGGRTFRIKDVNGNYFTIDKSNIDYIKEIPV